MPGAFRDACPKCGHRKPSGDWFAGPRYSGNRDVLVWTCLRCGFEFETPPLDAKDPLQGWTPS